MLTDLPGELMSHIARVVPVRGSTYRRCPSLTGAAMPAQVCRSSLTSPLTSPVDQPGLTDLPLPVGLALPGSLASRPAPPWRQRPATRANRLTNPALTSPTGATPGSPTGLDPRWAAPASSGATPVGLDPRADGTYPISVINTGGPCRAAATTSTGGGGLVNDVIRVANELGASQFTRPAKRCANAVDVQAVRMARHWPRRPARQSRPSPRPAIPPPTVNACRSPKPQVGRKRTH